MTRFRRAFAEDELHMAYVKTAAAIEELRRCYALLEQAETLLEKTELCTHDFCDLSACRQYKQFLEGLERE